MKTKSLVLFLIAGLFTLNIHAQFAGGSGTPEDPYQVATLEQLQAIGNIENLDKHFIQVADIDASETVNWNDGKGFKPIGYGPAVFFSGKYYGNDFQISNLYINRLIEDISYSVGLFGLVKFGTIENTSIISSQIHGGSIVGGIIGILDSSEISNLRSQNGAISSLNTAGGLVGEIWSGTVLNSYAKVEVSGQICGGLAGYFKAGSIYNSFSNCNITGGLGSLGVGGLIGATNGGAIENSYSKGNVNGNESVGGLVGNYFNSTAILNSFSASHVIGNVNVGGFLGSTNWEEPNIENCYWDIESSSQNSGYPSIFFKELNGLTTAQMTGFAPLEFMTGFDSGIFKLTENYPALYWEDVEALYLYSPDTTLLTFPLNGSLNQNPQINFSWEPSFFAQTYDIQISENESFSDLIIDIQGIETNYFLVSELEFSTSYYWRVRASNPLGIGIWSEIWSFSTLTPPDAPSLASPFNGSVNLSIDPELSWGLVDYADNYGIQVSALEDFSEIQFEAQNIEGNALSVSGLDYSTQYYWRVKASNEAGTGPWSEVWSFTTLVPPDAPSLVSPSNDSTNHPVSLELNWSLTAFADTYGIQVSALEDFSEIQFEAQNIEGTTVAASGLDYSTQYFWRVNASNEAGTGTWSVAWSFTTIVHFALEVYSGDIYCEGDLVSLGISLNATFEGGNIFKVELSDMDGSFDTPVIVYETETNLPFSVGLNLTENIPMGSTHLLRVRSSSPEAISEAFPITFYAYPEYDFVVNPEELCWGEAANVVYMGYAGENTTFDWDFDGGSVLSGQGEGPYQVSWSEYGYKLIVLNVSVNGCTSTNGASLFVAPQTQPNPICMVTVNDENKNMILFEQPEANSYESISIYKEGSQAGIYSLIGTQVANGVGYFVDVDSNPAQNSSRYKIAVVDTCGYETPMSAFHKSMHLTISAGINGSWNLIWDKYEGFNYSTFNIYRGTSEGSLNLIAELPSNLFTYTDQAPPAGTTFYQIEVVNPNPCDISLEKSGKEQISTSRSNLVNSQQATSVLETGFDQLVVWPNPTRGVLYIQGNFAPGDRSVEILSTNGNILKRLIFQNEEKEIDLSGLPEGVYFIRIISGKEIYHKRVIKL